MARKAKDGSNRQGVGSLPSQITVGVGGSGGTRDSGRLMVDESDESDAAQEQRRIRAAGKRKEHEDLPSEDNQSQLTCTRPSNIPSHISLGAPVTHRTVKDLTSTFLMDAKYEVSKPDFIRWFIATCSYRCSPCARDTLACGYPPVADSTQRNFKCTACRNGHKACSWLLDLIEVYIREAYQLDVGEARILATSTENNPQGTLSSYYRAWLADPAVRSFDDELREKLKDHISWERPRKRKKGGRISPEQHDLRQQGSEKRPSTKLSLLEPQPMQQKRVKLIVTLPPDQPPPAKASSSPPPLAQALRPLLAPAQGPSTLAPVKISPSGSRLLPDQATLPPLPPVRSPSTTPPATIATLEIHSNVPQDHSPAKVDDRHATTHNHPNDNPIVVLSDFNAGTDETFAGADSLPPSCDIIKLKSDMAALSDELAKLAVEDISLQADFSNRQEAESYLLKMLQGSLQTCDFLRSIVDEQESRYATVIGGLGDRIRLLTLENGQLKQGIAAKCLEQKICLLEVENDQLRGRLDRQDQELEDGMLQGRAIKDMEPKIGQLEVEIEQLLEKIAQQDRVIASMSARAQLADCLLRLTSQQDLPAPDDTQVDTNFKGLVSLISAHLNGI